VAGGGVRLSLREAVETVVEHGWREFHDLHQNGATCKIG